MRKLKRFLPGVAILCLVLVLMPFSVASANGGGTTVWIDVPTEVPYCTEFTARVNIDDVEDLDSYQFKLIYDETVIGVVGA